MKWIRLVPLLSSFFGCDAFQPVPNQSLDPYRLSCVIRNDNPLFAATIDAASSDRITARGSTEEEVIHNPSNPIASIAFLIQNPNAPTKFGSSSPIGHPSLMQGVRHLCDKAYWFADGLVKTSIVTLDETTQGIDIKRFSKTNVLIAIGVERRDLLEKVWEARRSSPSSSSLCHFCLESSFDLPAKVGPFDCAVSPSLSSRFLPWTRDATARRLYNQMNNLFSRWTSDDFTYALMIFINQFIAEVDWVKHSIDATWEKGPIRNAKELYSMVTKCGGCIKNCVRDPKCRECIGRLTQVDSRDQVQSYKTIVSYESDLLRDFSLCILTKNNIFNCDATIPTIPQVPPLRRWRGQTLTEEDGRSILVGHLDDDTAPQGGRRLPVSWKVACGANVAYDQFPSQNQLFYPAARGRDMWYDPVFRVRTLDDRNVWCKRHYKVRPANEPGTFRLSVLDNGVTSNEFWTIVGAADDLSWVVFHYAGAASAVGQRYLGGLLCTPDGMMPADEKLPEIWDCFRRAGIQPWELYRVDNDDHSSGAMAAGPPPLDFYRAEVLARRASANNL